MRLRLLILVISLIVSFSNKSKQYNGPSEEDVIVVDEDTIQQTIYDSEEPWFLDLFADWCSHCRDMRPEWAKLATRLKGVIKVAKMGAGGKLSFLEGYDFKGYPILVFLPAGKKSKRLFYNYEGPRTVNDMAIWAMQKLQESKGLFLPRIISQQVWDEYCINVKKPLCVIFILPHIRDSSLNERAVMLETIRQVNNQVTQTILDIKDSPISFLWTQATDHPEIEHQFGFGSGYPVVMLVNQFRKAYTVMKSSLTKENMLEFFNRVLTPTKQRTKLGQYSKELAFSSVTVEEDTAVPTGESYDEDL